MMDVQTRLRELKVGPVRAQVEGRDGDRYFVVSGEELLLLDPDVVQRVVLRDITKITSDNSGTLRVFAGDRVAIATPSRNFRSQLLKEFFIGVKNAVGHARLTSSAFNLPAIGSSGVDLPAVPFKNSLPETLLPETRAAEQPEGVLSRPYTQAVMQTPSVPSVPPSTPGPGYGFEASAPHPVPSSDVSASSSVSVVREPEQDTPPPTPGPTRGHSPEYLPMQQNPVQQNPIYQNPVQDASFGGIIPVMTPPQTAPSESEYTSKPSSELVHEPAHPVHRPVYPAASATPVTQATQTTPAASSPVIAINTAPPADQTITVTVPLSSSEGLRRLQLQIDSRVQSVRLMAIVAGVFGLLAGALLFSTSAIPALCLIVLGASCAAGFYFTAEVFGNLSRGLGEL